MVLVVKNLLANARDVRDAGLIPGLGRTPEGGYGNTLHYSCLENLMDRGVWWATVHRILESQTRLKQLSTHTVHPPFRRASWQLLVVEPETLRLCRKTASLVLFYNIIKIDKTSKICLHLSYKTKDTWDLRYIESVYKLMHCMSKFSFADSTEYTMWPFVLMPFPLSFLFLVLLCMYISYLIKLTM